MRYARFTGVFNLLGVCMCLLSNTNTEQNNTNVSKHYLACNMQQVVNQNEDPDRFMCKNGTVKFESEASFETIKAQSTALNGVYDIKARTFEFSVSMKTFDGFNSPLQKEHFHEDYLESDRFPKATFTGRILETSSLEGSGKYTVRAKGKLNVHGVEQERIIKIEIFRKGSVIIISSDFTVPLEDHNITVPRLVQQKISKIIKVSVNANLLAI